MNKPNIIFILSDQQRPDTMGIYGQRLPVTPNLDALANDGVCYQNAFTCNPVCGPARAALQTGLYPTANGCYRNNIALSRDIPTVAGYLNQNSYDTAYIGKWHLASDAEADYKTINVPVSRRGGYKYWMASDVLEFTSNAYDGYVFDTAGQKVEFSGYRADCITDFALEYVEQADRKKPFFMQLSYIEPHHQNGEDRYIGPEGSKEKWADFSVPGDLEGLDGDWKENYPDYLGCCNSIDGNVRRLINLLKQEKLYDNTVLIYSSDHGSHFRTRNSEYKRSCHDNSIHIPLIIRGGVFRGGRCEKGLVSLIDIPATILSLAGCPQMGLHGNDLSQGKTYDAVFVQISESQVGRVVRDERYKYAVSAPDKCGWKDKDSDVYVEEFLYDLKSDPYEKKNLVSDGGYAKARKRLKKKLTEKMAVYGETVPKIYPRQI